MIRRIPTVVMRGGTSRALFFHENHLPTDRMVRDRIILAAMGSPDPNRRQIDGLGGAVSSTSKVAVIRPSNDPEYDVSYCFGQVHIDQPKVDYKSNCGNIASAVGPYAVDEGLVSVTTPVTRVRIHQANTDKLIVADVPVVAGQYDCKGDYAIDGVPGTGGRIDLHFHDPGGSLNGKMLPTGNPKDSVEIPGLGAVTASLVDAATPCVFVRASDLGLEGIEIDEVDPDKRLKDRLELIRGHAAVFCSLAPTPGAAADFCRSVPKVAFVSPPHGYVTVSGRKVEKDEVDIVIRLLSMGALHKALAVTGAICCAGTARIPGTVVNEVLGSKKEGPIRLGHPGGVMEVSVDMDIVDSTPVYRKAVIGRTARRLMEGYVLVDQRLFDV